MKTRVSLKFFVRGCSSIFSCKVTGNILDGSSCYGLEIPVTYSCTGLQAKTSEEMKIIEKMKNKCLK